MNTPLTLLNVPVRDASKKELKKLLDQAIEEERLAHVVTLNPEFLVEAQHNKMFRAVLNNADSSIVDGVGLVYAGLLYGRFLHRWTGVDLVRWVCKRAAKKGYRVFLLGAGPGVAAQAAVALQNEFDGLEVYSSPGSPRVREESAEERSRLVAEINAVRPHILLVAYGAPMQDVWVAENRAELSVNFAVGVGGTFDYLTGAVYRAPLLVRRLGLEWVVRLVQQPRVRSRRIWRALVVFPLLVLRERLMGR